MEAPRFTEIRHVKMEGGKVVSTIHRPPLPPGKIPDTHSVTG